MVFPNLRKGFHELNIKRRSEYKFPNCDELMSCSHCVICVLGEQQIMPVLPAIILDTSGDKNKTFHLYLYNRFTTKTLPLLHPGSPVTSGWRLTVYDNMAGGSHNSCMVWKATVWRCSIWSKKKLWLKANNLTLILFGLKLKRHLWSSGSYLSLKGIKFFKLWYLPSRRSLSSKL